MVCPKCCRDYGTHAVYCYSCMAKALERIQELEAEVERLKSYSQKLVDSALSENKAELVQEIDRLRSALMAIKDGPVSTFCGNCIGRVECAEQVLKGE